MPRLKTRKLLRKKKINIDDHDLKIMEMRAVGYKEVEIAKKFGVSQSAISQRLKKIREMRDLFSINIVLNVNQKDWGE